MKTLVYFFLTLLFNSVNAGYGQPISKIECLKCKCTLEEIELYRSNGVELIPKIQNFIMCDMDIFDINLDHLFKDSYRS